MTAWKKKLTGPVVGGIAWAGVVLCVAGNPARAQTEHATLAIPSVTMNILAEYVAEDSHLWQKRGLDVKVLNIKGVGSINAVIAKSADFAISSGTSISRAYARGQKLVALATAINQAGQNVIIRKDLAEAAHFDPTAKLATRAQILKGRTIAVDAVGSISDLTLMVVAKSAGLTRDQMIVTPMQPPEFLAAFARHTIDGFSGTPPFIQYVLLSGAGVILSDSAKGEPTEYSPVSSALLMTRADFCPTQKTICEKMVQGFVEAARIIRTDPSATLAIMKARYATYDDKVLSAAYEMVRAMTPDPPVTTTKELENGELMNIAAGLLKPEEKLADYTALIDNEFVR